MTSIETGPEFGTGRDRIGQALTAGEPLSKKQLDRIKKRITEVERLIEEIETTLAEISAEMASPEVAADINSFNEVTTRYSAGEAEIQALHAEWEELSEQLGE